MDGIFRDPLAGGHRSDTICVGKLHVFYPN